MPGFDTTFGESDEDSHIDPDYNIIDYQSGEIIGESGPISIVPSSSFQPDETKSAEEDGLVFYEPENIERADGLRPPAVSVFIASLFLPADTQEYVIGCLDEIYYNYALPKFGAKRAKWWYRWFIFRACFSVVIDFLKDLLTFRQRLG